MSLTLIDLAARLKGWRGSYLQYACAVTDTGTAPLLAEYRPHLERVIYRRSGVSSTAGLSPNDPRREATSKVIAAYATVTARRRDALADYFLGRAVHDALLAPGIVVTARSPSGAETLRRVDLTAARVDIVANSLTIGGVAYAHVQIETSPVSARTATREPVTVGDLVTLGNVEAPIRKPTMRDVIVAWFRTPEGQAYRHRSNRVTFAAFKKVHPDYKDRKGNKTTIAAARRELGWAPRGNQAANKSKDRSMAIGQ